MLSILTGHWQLERQTVEKGLDKKTLEKRGIIKGGQMGRHCRKEFIIEINMDKARPAKTICL